MKNDASNHGVLLLGATGRTGSRVLTQLLERDVPVRAIVRSAERLPAGATADPRLTVVEADVTTLPGEELRRLMARCDAVVSCLGHNVSLRGVFGPPRDLVARTVERLCDTAAALGSAESVRLVLMSSVSVNRPARADARRGFGERAFAWLLRALLPPARDNQRAADFLALEVGAAAPFVEWVVVRPDSLLDGEVSAYRTHDGIVSSLFRADGTRLANVAHFMVELVTDDAAWRSWRGKMPVVVDDPGREGRGGPLSERGERGG
jgi:nucleoside-diphosphate-sugar epimerase